MSLVTQPLAINQILSMGLLHQDDNRLGHGASDTDLSLVVLSKKSIGFVKYYMGCVQHSYMFVMKCIQSVDNHNDYFDTHTLTLSLSLSLSLSLNG